MRKQAEMNMPLVCDEMIINIGPEHSIIVDKLFGPTGGAPVRISLDMTDYSWVIEQRLCPAHDSEGNCDKFIWKERARFDMQPLDDACYAESYLNDKAKEPPVKATLSE